MILMLIAAASVAAAPAFAQEPLTRDTGAPVGR